MPTRVNWQMVIRRQSMNVHILRVCFIFIQVQDYPETKISLLTLRKKKKNTFLFYVKIKCRLSLSFKIQHSSLWDSKNPRIFLESPSLREKMKSGLHWAHGFFIGIKISKLNLLIQIQFSSPILNYYCDFNKYILFLIINGEVEVSCKQ